jgi:catechol 2,3-dioxygenase-like lactoylglutathione lyase family enzyme
MKDLNKITANLIVASMEESLAFWVDRLGFEKTVEVPESDKDSKKLGFVILKNGANELMLQSRAALEKDVAAIADGPHRGILYLEVASLDPVRKALGDWPLVVPERTTFYGAKEIIVRAPSGHVVFFAAH